MRRCGLGVATASLVLGPTVLAFFTGGYFAGPRAWAGIGAWACLVVALLAGARLPQGRPALLAIGGLGLLAVWTLLSILWAPIAGDAYGAGQIAVLYLGALTAGTMLMRGRAAEWVEPGLAAGALIVIGYSLAGRLLPGVLHLARSVSAQGRLEQPLTYWNAMGELAALGFVLCARLAGDATRPAAMRSAAAAAAAPLGLGLYISFSRGALFACGAGLVMLTVLAPRREQLRATGAAILVAALAALAGATFKGVTGLTGSLSQRERQGAIVFVLLLAVTALAALAQRVADRRQTAGVLRLPRAAPLVATGVVAAGLALAIIVGAHESSASPSLSGGATRLTSLQSNRYDYWSVALRAFASSPLHGVGAGGWSVDWLRWRHVNEFADDAHSLELQTLAELGLVGVGLLVAAVAGIVLAARRQLRAGAAAAPGVIAALVVYLVHSPLDWDWQMPAVTLVAMVLAGVLLGGAVQPAEREGALAFAARRAPIESGS